MNRFRQIHRETVDLIRRNPKATRKALALLAGITSRAMYDRLSVCVQSGAVAVEMRKTGRYRECVYTATGLEPVAQGQPPIRSRHSDLKALAERRGWLDPSKYIQPKARGVSA